MAKSISELQYVAVDEYTNPDITNEIHVSQDDNETISGIFYLDQDSNIVRIDAYDSDGNIEKTYLKSDPDSPYHEIVSYEDNVPDYKERFDEKGNIEQIDYYDDYGTVIETEIYDKDGNLVTNDDVKDASGQVDSKESDYADIADSVVNNADSEVSHETETYLDIEAGSSVDNQKDSATADDKNDIDMHDRNDMENDMQDTDNDIVDRDNDDDSNDDYNDYNDLDDAVGLD